MLACLGTVPSYFYLWASRLTLFDLMVTAVCLSFNALNTSCLKQTLWHMSPCLSSSTLSRYTLHLFCFINHAFVRGRVEKEVRPHTQELERAKISLFFSWWLWTSWPPSWNCSFRGYEMDMRAIHLSTLGNQWARTCWRLVWLLMLCAQHAFAIGHARARSGGVTVPLIPPQESLHTVISPGSFVNCVHSRKDLRVPWNHMLILDTCLCLLDLNLQVTYKRLVIRPAVPSPRLWSGACVLAHAAPSSSVSYFRTITVPTLKPVLNATLLRKLLYWF